MISKEENELLCRTGPGTPMGELFRRFWLPVALSRELPKADCPPVRLRILSEDLIAFRDTTGRVGLLGRYCPHRGASLFFGRNEQGGLRCVYHGWKFDGDGHCVDMPNEPAESNFRTQILMPSYTLIPSEPGAPISFTGAVPVDDTHMVGFTVTWSPDGPLAEEHI